MGVWERFSVAIVVTVLGLFEPCDCMACEEFLG